MTNIVSDSNTASEPHAEVISVEPKELRVQCVLNQEESYTILLHNTTDKLVAYKVKTTTPGRYRVRPKQGTVTPNGEASICIILVRLVQLPDASNPRNLRDKFLVLSLHVDDAIENENELIQLWRQLEREHNPKMNQWRYHEQKVKCRLIVPNINDISQRANSPASLTSIEQDGSSTMNRHDDDNDHHLIQSSASTVSHTHTETTSDTDARSTQLSTSTIVEPEAKVNASSDNVAADVDVEHSERVKSSDAEITCETTPNIDETKTHHVISPGIGARGIQPGRSVIREAREYDKMLSYTVKLTAEREALDTKLQMMNDKFDILRDENNEMKRLISKLKTTSSHNASDSMPPTLIDAINDAGLRHRNPLSGAPLIDDTNTRDTHIESLHIGTGIQVWQVLMVAALCFLLGRWF